MFTSSLDQAGLTALHYASELDQYKTVRLLLEAKANVNIQTKVREIQLYYCEHIAIISNLDRSNLRSSVKYTSTLLLLLLLTVRRDTSFESKLLWLSEMC